MKKIAFWNNYTSFANNQAFNPKAYGIGEDLGYPIILLKEKFEKKGYILETLDLDDIENYEYVIFSDVPNPITCCKDLKSIPKEKKILILEECEMIYHENARTDLLNEYSKVFAYNDDLVKNVGYIKLNMPNKIKYPEVVPFCNKKFSTMIAGNKRVPDSGELYSERIKIIHYMEKNNENDFDLYGMGWNTKIFTGPKIIRALNRIPLATKIFAEKYRSYKGKVDKKLDTLKNYRFCFCYENSNKIPGYISEKIMDCFFAGCVPVYYGAPNITEYIPENCFIDWRKFKNYDDLYNFLKNLNEKEYSSYIENINNFLHSTSVYTFSAECFAETIINEVLG